MKTLTTNISNWIKNYTSSAGMETLVIGVSGGIDSAVTSTLCAETGLDTIVLTMPIRQAQSQQDLSVRHATQLVKKYRNVSHKNINLTSTFEQFDNLFTRKNGLASANSRSRLRMMALYHTAQSRNGLVVGTGNKIEDFGIGFFTKYGDGGVDISPIADLTKSEVWELGKELDVDPDIINATPADGLWDDGRVDQDQLLGLTYPQLEKAMYNYNNKIGLLSDEEQLHVAKYLTIREANLHKMQPIPVFKNNKPT